MAGVSDDEDDEDGDEAGASTSPGLRVFQEGNPARAEGAHM